MASSKAPITSQDGSDADYRMKVDDVYKSMAKMRRNLKISTKVQTIYILARSAWKFLPSFITGTITLFFQNLPPPPTPLFFSFYLLKRAIHLLKNSPLTDINTHFLSPQSPSYRHPITYH